MCVECYCSTTPTECPSTMRGMYVGHPVVANIVFVAISDFFVLLLSEQYVLKYTTENLSGQQLVLVS